MLISLRAIDFSGSGQNPNSLLLSGQYLIFEVTINGVTPVYTQASRHLGGGQMKKRIFISFIAVLLILSGCEIEREHGLAL